MGPGEALTVMTMFIACGGTVFGYVYLRSRENMALIERGINPRRPSAAPERSYLSLKYGLLLIGAGIGLLLAFCIDTLITHKGLSSYVEAGEVMHHNTSPVYFALLAIGGGMGLWLSYKIRAKQALPAAIQED